MAEMFLCRRGNSFVPAWDDDLAALARIREGEIVKCKYTVPRNWKFHKKFFALLQIVVDNTSYDNVEQVLHLMKLKLGLYESIVNTNGKVIYKPKSISFASMDNFEFEKFYNQSVNKVLSDFLTDWKDEDVQRAVEQVVRF